MDKDATKTITLPCCGYAINAHQWLDGPDSTGNPKPGNLSICLNCGTILIFVTAEALKTARAADCMAMPQEQRESLFRLRSVIKERGKFK